MNQLRINDLAIIATFMYLRHRSDESMYERPLPQYILRLLDAGYLAKLETKFAVGKRGRIPTRHVILDVTPLGKKALQSVPFVDIMRELAKNRIQDVIDYWMGDITLGQLPEFLAHKREEVRISAKKRLIMIQEYKLYAVPTT